MKAKIKKANKYPYDLRTLLKVKIKSLAEEARIIRKEEQRTDSLNLYRQFNGHRRSDLRHESRHALLAYGFLRGMSLHRIEQSDQPVDWAKIRRLVSKYGPVEREDCIGILERLDSWSSVTV